MTGSSIYNPGVNVQDVQLREDLANALDPLLGAALVGFDEALAYPAGLNIGTRLKTLITQVTNLQASVTIGYASIEDFGAVGDGVTDDSAAFAAALLVNERIYLPNPPVAYLVSTPIVIATNGVKFLGENQFLSTIRASSASLPVISILPGVTGVEINNIHLDRAVIATPTGSGIECSGMASNHTFQYLVIDKQWDAIAIGEGSSNQITNCKLLNNYGHGISQVTGSTSAALWDIRDNQIGYNNGSGMAFAATGVSANTDLGELVNNFCIYNVEYGIKAVGVNTKHLNALRVQGGVYSYNGLGGIYFDSYGERHRIAGVSSNFTGTSLTGRQAAQTSASNIGSGIQVTSSVEEIAINGNTCNRNSHSGMHLSATLATVVGNNCLDNGANAGAPVADRSGMKLSTGKLLVSSNSLTNKVSGAGTQQQGIHITGGVNCLLANNQCVGNMNAIGIVIATPSSTNRINNNAGYNPQPMDVVVAGASPWTYTAGNAREEIYLRGGTFTILSVDGVTIATAASATTQYLLVPLMANQSFTLTYTVAPTVNRKIN